MVYILSVGGHGETESGTQHEREVLQSHISGRGAGAQSGHHGRSGDPSRAGQRALFMGIRNETVETLSETGARSPKRPRRTRSSTSRPRGASPPASMLARRSGVSAVAVEASMDNAREEGKRKLIESAREFPKVAAQQSPNGSLREVRERLSPGPAQRSPTENDNVLAALSWPAARFSWLLDFLAVRA